MSGDVKMKEGENVEMIEDENIIINNIKHQNDTFSMIDFAKYQLELDNAEIVASNLKITYINSVNENNDYNVDDENEIENEDENEDDNDDDTISIKSKTNIIDSVSFSINEIFDSIKNLQAEFKCVQKKIILLKRDYAKVVNISNKLELKKNKQKTKLQTGFIKPRPISNKMCLFLDLEPGSSLGRNEVTTRIHNYIVTNNLRDDSDRRIILPNAELRVILDYKSDNIIPLSYFNLQSYLKKHFI